VFQDILIKPLWIQACKDNPFLEKDLAFRSQLGLKYISDNQFKINQEMEIITKKKEIIDALNGVLGEEDKPYFSMSYLIENFMGLTRKDIIANQEAKERKEKEKKKGEEGKAEEEVTL
jgi:rRNA processing protein Gar1